MIALIRSEWRGLIATLGVCFVLVASLELRHPYYFLQDDGLEYFLPSYIQNLRSMSSGHFPLYNFHTFGGIPHLSMGQPASLYVPPYLALLLSRSIFGHFFAAIDILAVFHLMVAIVGSYLLLRYWGVGASAAVFGGMTSLSGFCLLVGRMWPPALMLCAWFPWMLLAAERYVHRPSVERAGLLIAVRLALFYGGYPQFFILAMVFEHVFILVRVLAGNKDRRKTLLLYLAALVPTLLLACPLLLPMAAEVHRSQSRATALPYTQFSSLLLPPVMWLYGQIFAGLPLTPSPSEWEGALLYVSHIGYVTSFLSIGAVFLLMKRQHRLHMVVLPCIICCLLALFWAWNFLGPAIYHLPLLNRFRWPFKLVYFSGFFQCVLAATFLDRCRGRWHALAIVAFALGWLGVYCMLPSHAWRVRDHQPPLATAWKSLLEDGRYVVLSRNLVGDKSEEFVGFNYSEMWGLDNLLGYEPLIATRGAPGGFGDVVLDYHSGAYSGMLDSKALNRFTIWSVKHILVSPDSQAASQLLQLTGWQVIAENKGWKLWGSPKALPRVRWDNQLSGVDEGITWSVEPNAIDITLEDWPGRSLTLAYTDNPGLSGCLDTKCTEVSHSEDGLVHIEVPRGTHHVRLVYRNRLFTWGAWIAITTALALFVMRFWLRSDKAYTIDSIGGGGQNRTADLRVMRPSEPVDSKGNQQLSPAESSKSRKSL